MKRHGWATAFVASAFAGLLGSTGCSTSSYCFDDCGPGGSAAKDGGGATDGGGTGGINVDGGGSGGSGAILFGGSGGGEACVKNGDEICNGVDDDCNGKIDDGIDSTRPSTAARAINCTRSHTLDPNCTTPSCDARGPPASSTARPRERASSSARQTGTTTEPPGQDCEYHCPWNPNGTNTTDPGGAFGCGKDDDCDGKSRRRRQHVHGDRTNCGKCGKLVRAAQRHRQVRDDRRSGAAVRHDEHRLRGRPVRPGLRTTSTAAANGCEYACPAPHRAGNLRRHRQRLRRPDRQRRPEPRDRRSERGEAPASAAPRASAPTVAHQGISKCIGGADQRAATPDSNNVNGTNPNLPVNGVRNGVCDAPTGAAGAPAGRRAGDVQQPRRRLRRHGGRQPHRRGRQCGSSVGQLHSRAPSSARTARWCASARSTRHRDLQRAGRRLRRRHRRHGPDRRARRPARRTPTAPAASLPASERAPRQGVRDGPTSDAVRATATSRRRMPCRCRRRARRAALACVGGAKTCVRVAVRASRTRVDACGVDSNCDGTLDNQPNLQTDVKNCGTCGNDCNASQGGHGAGACVSGRLRADDGCDTGFINCDANANDCEKACTFDLGARAVQRRRRQLQLPGRRGPRDACPTPVQVCGVAAAATEAGCKPGAVGVGSRSPAPRGAWKCTFPAGYCNNAAAPNYCAGARRHLRRQGQQLQRRRGRDLQAPDAQDQGYLGQPCASDDGKPPPGDGACRATGTLRVQRHERHRSCNATKNLTQGCAELCDGIDNDCDGSVDEPFIEQGHERDVLRQAGRRPRSRQPLGVSSTRRAAPTPRPRRPASGNGYRDRCRAPRAGSVTLDKTVACSVVGQGPVVQRDARRSRADLRRPRRSAVQHGELADGLPGRCACTLGLRPGARRGVHQHVLAAAKCCNLGSFDFDRGTGAAIQDGLLADGVGGARELLGGLEHAAGQRTTANRQHPRHHRTTCASCHHRPERQRPQRTTCSSRSWAAPSTRDVGGRREL